MRFRADGRALDHDRGGYFRIASADPEAGCKQLYYPDTAVLVTRFMSPDGVGEVIDWVPPNTSRAPTDRHTPIRTVRSVRGTVRFDMECRPRFDYGRAAHELGLRPEAAVFRAPGVCAYLQSTSPVERDGDDLRGSITLSVGEEATVVLTVCDADGKTPPPPAVDTITEQLWDAADFRQKRVRGSNYRGRWPDMVNRSAITLKLLTYAPAGAPVAAATMGLPEQVGGERNWDHRYTRVRDGSLSVRALLDLGFVEEATDFTHRLGDRLRETSGKADAQVICAEPALEHENVTMVAGANVRPLEDGSEARFHGDIGPRRRLQGSRPRQPACRGHQLLPQHRRGEPVPDRHRQRDARRRPHRRTHPLGSGQSLPNAPRSHKGVRPALLPSRTTAGA